MFRKVMITMIAGAATFLAGSLSFAANVDISNCEYKRFKVTSYYSPIPGQGFYYRGNLEDERILNGFGTHGASGRAVFNGMLAAPAGYEFGTKIYFPQRGVGKVEDRGGAIVEKGERSDATETRIDIYAGAGEEGLKRALSFGVQYTDAYVCPNRAIPDSKVGFNYNSFPHYDDFFHASLWVLGLWPERKDPWVKALQNYLIAMGYMGEGRNTGFYGRETKAALCKYQQHYLGMDGQSERCGYFGPQTRYDMKNRVKRLGLSNLYGPASALMDQDDTTQEPGLDTVNQMVQKTTTDVLLENAGQAAVAEVVEPVVIPETLDERIINHMFTKGEFASYTFDENQWKGREGKVVRVLQRKLQRLGFLPKDMKITGVYDAATVSAVYTFQLEHGILDNTSAYSVRGYFGPSTRAMVNSL